MNNKKVFCTGCGGFIGQYLSRKLIEDGYEVHGLFTKVETAKKKAFKGVKIYTADLREYKEIGSILKSINPDFIIHLAARTEVHKSFNEPMEFSEINYCGTVNLIEKAKLIPDLKLFLFSSTMETYGWQPKYKWEPFDENTVQNPNAPYAVAKVGCEKYLEYAGRMYDLPYTILRQTNAYGRWDNDFFVVEQIITQMLQNKKEVFLGHKKPFRNFLFIDDLIKLYSVVLNRYGDASGHTFCTGPDNAVTIEGLAKMIARKLNWNGKIHWRQKDRIRGNGEVYYLNSTPEKAMELLGWRPEVELSDGLDRTIRLWADKFKSNEL